MTGREQARARVLAVAERHRGERDAAITALEDAAAALATGAPIWPEGLREPVRHYLRASAELCRGARTIWGLPVTYALQMAAAITETRAGEGAVAGGQGAGDDQPGRDQPPGR